VWLVARSPAPETPAFAPAGPAAGPPPAPAAAAREPAPAASAPRAPAGFLPAALARAFRGAALPAALGARLAAGDVEGVAAALAASTAPGAAAALHDLAALCAEESQPDAAAGAEQDAIATAGADAAALALVTAEIGARHAFRQRILAGCRTALLDEAAVTARLRAGGEAGDAASLERLAARDPQPLGRMTSAALLGDAAAQFHLALEYLPRDPRLARSWLEAGARGDADALGFLGACQLNGCFGAPDPVAAAATLEAAARQGSRYALGLLATSGGDDAGRWPVAGVPVAPLPPRDADALALDPATRYAWSEFARGLATAGCFGFDFPTTAAALVDGAALERDLTAGELAAGRAAATALEHDAGTSARSALGCTGGDAAGRGSR
jgi:hypothetical protein